MIPIRSKMFSKEITFTSTSLALFIEHTISEFFKMTSFTVITPLYFSSLLVMIIIKGYLFNPTIIANLNKKGKS